MAEPLRIRGDVSREERRQHRECRDIVVDAQNPERECRIFCVPGGSWDNDLRTGPTDRRGPVSARHAELEAEVLRLRGFQAALEENARLHKLLDDSMRLLADADYDPAAAARWGEDRHERALDLDRRKEVTDGHRVASGPAAAAAADPGGRGGRRVPVLTDAGPGRPGPALDRLHAGDAAGACAIPEESQEVQ